MDRPFATEILVAGLGLILLMPLAAGRGAAVPVRQSFEIAAGSAADEYFPLGELIARVVSHPPGLARCEKPGVCGPAGLIVSTRSSEGAVADVLAVETGETASALAPGNVVADAVAGRGAGRLRHVRSLAALSTETMQLAVSARSRIGRVGDLAGKRISLGSAGAGGDLLARQILAACGVKLRRLKLRHDSYDAGAGLLRQGRIDALFFLGAAPSPLIAGLAASGSARLISVDGRALRRLLMRHSGLAAASIPAGTYGNAAAIGTVGTRVLWIVKDTAAPATVYGLVRALFDPANRAQFAAAPPADQIRLADALNGLAAPLHPGAERFYRETGRLRGR